MMRLIRDDLNWNAVLPLAASSSRRRRSLVIKHGRDRRRQRLRGHVQLNASVSARDGCSVSGRLRRRRSASGVHDHIAVVVLLSILDVQMELFHRLLGGQVEPLHRLSDLCLMGLHEGHHLGMNRLVVLGIRRVGHALIDVIRMMLRRRVDVSNAGVRIVRMIVRRRVRGVNAGVRVVVIVNVVHVRVRHARCSDGGRDQIPVRHRAVDVQLRHMSGHLRLLRRRVRGSRDVVHGALLFVVHARALLPIRLREILVVLRPHVDPLRLSVQGRGDVTQIHHVGISVARSLNDLGLSLVYVPLAILEFLEFLFDAAETSQFERVPHRERPAVGQQDARVVLERLLDIRPRLLLSHVRCERLEIATLNHCLFVSLSFIEVVFSGAPVARPEIADALLVSSC